VTTKTAAVWDVLPYSQSGALQSGTRKPDYMYAPNFTTLYRKLSLSMNRLTPTPVWRDSNTTVVLLIRKFFGDTASII